MNNKPKTYSTDFKRSVLNQLQTGELKSIGEARKKYSIGGKMSIQRWAKELNIDILKKKVVTTVKTFQVTDNDKLLKALGISYLRILELEYKFMEGHGQQVL